MCEEQTLGISKCSEGTERPVAPNDSETTVMPTELSTTNQTPSTDERAQGDLSRDYEQKFANLPVHLKLTKLCSNAGLANTVEKRHYFTTLDDAELDKLGGSCREYTLLGSEETSRVRGWVRGNTKIGPVLDVAVSCHQGRYRVEIMIISLFGDGTRSWVWDRERDQQIRTGNVGRDSLRRHWSEYGEIPLRRQDRNKQHVSMLPSTTIPMPYHGQEGSTKVVWKFRN